MSRSKLARLHLVMGRRVDDGELPGLVTGVCRHGYTDANCIGTMAVGEAEPMARDSIFRISSMTKPIIGVAAMTLIEQCVIRLEDPIGEWLPEMASPQVLVRLDGPVADTVPARRPITVRDLLTYTAGYGAIFAPPGTYPVQQALAEATGDVGPPAPPPEPGMDEWIGRLAAVPLLHQPGEQWRYNTSADILGVLIQRASGKPLESYLRESIFEPIGMPDTGFTVPDTGVGRLTTSYLTNPDGTLDVFDRSAGGRWTVPPGMPLGSGGLVSTLDDLLAFGRALLNSGPRDRGRILSRPAIQLMTTDQLTPEQKVASEWAPGFFGTYSWGLGMGVISARTSIFSVGAFGWDGGLGTSMWMDPAEDLVGVLLTQQSWTSPVMPPICRDFWAATYAAIDD